MSLKINIVFDEYGMGRWTYMDIQGDHKKYDETIFFLILRAINAIEI